MKMIMAILSVALLILVDEASAQSTYSVSVSRHASVPALSEKQVRQILKDASKMLQKNAVSNGDADVACDVTFTLKGPVRTFGSVRYLQTSWMSSTETQRYIRWIFRCRGRRFLMSKVVKEINFCRPGA